jgi:hypothetical protein
MSANLDHWYPPAAVTKNLKRGNWEYRIGKGGHLVWHQAGVPVHRFFKRKSDAICFAEEQLAKHQISRLEVYTASGSLSYHKVSRLWKAIEEAKAEAVRRYTCEMYDMREKYTELQEKADKWDKVAALFEAKDV